MNTTFNIKLGVETKGRSMVVWHRTSGFAGNVGGTF
jgi:hypothetical protein